jgi:hypothetical protein
MQLANGNTVELTSKDSISLSATGAESNYSKIQTNSLALNSTSAMNIDDLVVKNAKLTTSSNDLSIQNMLIGQTTKIVTGNKYIVVDNTSFAPILDADVQMYITKIPASIIVDSSNNVKTDLVNVTRQNEHIRINNDLKYQSMNSAVTSLNETSLKNTNVSEKTIEKTEKMIYEMPTQTAYSDTIVQTTINNLVQTHLEESVTESNVFSIINVLGNNVTPETKPNNVSNQIKKNDKVSSL